MGKPKVKSKGSKKDKPEEALKPETPEEPPKWEPGPGDEIKPGEVDEMGNYFMEELDFLRLQSRKERRNNCNAQAQALRLKAELTQLKMTNEVNRLVNQAESMEKASRLHNQSIQDQLTELSKKYDIDFKDPTVHVDEELGKIIATDPTKGLPKLKRE